MSFGPELLTTEEMAAADRAAIAAGASGWLLMQRAGRAVADTITARWPPRRAVVLCGPGNNGGDGFVAAARLAAAGWSVRCALAADPQTLKGDAARAFAAWDGETLAAGPRALDDGALVIDALFGAGLARALDPELRKMLRAAETGAAPLVAIDLPSGLDGDSGRPLEYAPACDLTVTFHRKKPAHVLIPGRDLCGEVVVADIGLADPVGAVLHENDPGLWISSFPWPGPETHKHRRGRLVVVSGPLPNTGAARLAARAGLRVAAGVVSVLTPPDALVVHATALEAVMVKAFTTPTELAEAAGGAGCAVIGPAAGIGPVTCFLVEALAGAGCALVLDADVFTSFAEAPDDLFRLLGPDDVLTPHAGEFDRIFPGLRDGGSGRLAWVRDAARLAGAVVLLKGPDTVIAAPDGRCAVNTMATPWLATAGSGDVLAGLIGGLRAAGMDGFEAACAGVWIHGAAARAVGPGLIAGDLPEAVCGVLSRLDHRDPHQADCAKAR